MQKDSSVRASWPEMLMHYSETRDEKDLPESLRRVASLEAEVGVLYDLVLSLNWTSRSAVEFGTLHPTLMYSQQKDLFSSDSKKSARELQDALRLILAKLGTSPVSADLCDKIGDEPFQNTIQETLAKRLMVIISCDRYCSAVQQDIMPWMMIVCKGLRSGVVFKVRSSGDVLPILNLDPVQTVEQPMAAIKKLLIKLNAYKALADGTASMQASPTPMNWIANKGLLFGWLPSKFNNSEEVLLASCLPKLCSWADQGELYFMNPEVQDYRWKFERRRAEYFEEQYLLPVGKPSYWTNVYGTMVYELQRNQAQASIDCKKVGCEFAVGSPQVGPEKWTDVNFSFTARTVPTSTIGWDKWEAEKGLVAYPSEGAPGEPVTVAMEFTKPGTGAKKQVIHLVRVSTVPKVMIQAFDATRPETRDTNIYPNKNK